LNISWVAIKTGGTSDERLASKKINSPFESQWCNSRFTWRFVRSGTTISKNMGPYIARNNCQNGQGWQRKGAGRKQLQKILAIIKREQD
jgi:hypothetical protein